MRIAVCGGGPGGLLFALLAKKRIPEAEVVVFEQNPRATTYGWGIVFSGRAKSLIKDPDPDLFADLSKSIVSWDDLTIVHRDTHMPIDGSAFSGISRADLLRVLEEHAERAGVVLRFSTRISKIDDLGPADLVVVADGVNSALRHALADRFGVHSEKLTNKYAWYGTPRVFDTLTLTFREHEGGFFVAHSYPYSPEASTFLVECDGPTWERAGFASMSDAESRRFCAEVFAADLDGKELLSNKAQWLNFTVVKNDRWVHEHVVLLGDAARSVHFSIGSGTRSACEDAIALAATLERGRPIAESLARYEAERRPSAERLLGVAERSFAWYEEFPRYMALSASSFAYSYMTRGGLVDDATLQQRSPKFWEAYASAASAEARAKASEGR